MIKITECPRDAMQGIESFIPTEVKINYINLLLKIGFSRIDFGSFVSSKAVPQMRDTAKVVDKLNIEKNATSLLAIIANARGAQEATMFEQIDVLGFPFSISDTFQQRNTGSSLIDSFRTVDQICSICMKADRLPLVYLSMGFGNPYGDEWNAEMVLKYAEQLIQFGVKELILADTMGNSTPDKITYLYPMLQREFPNITWGIHLHSSPDSAEEKIKAALEAGCNQFDSALRGFGGCPLADDVLVGNIATETLLWALNEAGENHNKLDQDAWQHALEYSKNVFG